MPPPTCTVTAFWKAFLVMMSRAVTPARSIANVTATASAQSCRLVSVGTLFSSTATLNQMQRHEAMGNVEHDTSHQHAAIERFRLSAL